MKASLSLALAIYPPCFPLPSPSHPTDWPVCSYRKTRLSQPPYPLSLSSPLPPSGSCRFSVPSSLFPWFPSSSVSTPIHSPLLLNSAHHPRGIPTFLTATTAFIPSTVSGRRAYKDGPEFNKSDNVRVFRECT